VVAFGIVLAIGVAALIAYVRFGGPRIPIELQMVIDDVVSAEVPEVVLGSSGFATAGTIRLWYEDLTPPVPDVGTVLLLIGAGADALMWPRPFVDRLLGGGYRVVRYDQRETGLSDRIAGWQRNDPYTVRDLAEDAVAVLDHLEIDRAHIIGLSLGGMVAQEIAIRHPVRVASLVLMSTSPGVTDESLPSLSTRYVVGSAWAALPLLRYTIAGGEANLVAAVVAKMLTAGLRPRADEVRDLSQHVIYNLRKRRGINLIAAYHHQVAAAAAPPRSVELAQLRVPTLVVHGDADPILPVEHGRRLASTIPGARGIWLEGVGHAFPYPDWEDVTDSIVDHLQFAAVVEGSP
jgi:pimeloyl-ACP methyl ester carboxylesterase